MDGIAQTSVIVALSLKWCINLYGVVYFCFCGEQREATAKQKYAAFYIITMSTTS